MLAVAVVITVFILLKPKPVVYRQEKAVIVDLQTYYNFSGIVETINKQSATSQKNTKIKKIYYSEGTQVKAGTVIMKTSSGKKIKAMISGVTTEIYVEKDDVVSNGQELFDTVDYTSLQVKIKVDEYDLKNVRIREGSRSNHQCLR